MSRPRTSVCQRGHEKTPGRQCSVCRSERMAAWYQRRKHGVTPEIQAKREDDARAANARLEARGRCRHPMRRGLCGLLLPCWDHA